jgi:hypothetical protein
MSRTRWVRAALLVAVSASAGPALAAEPGESNEARAERLFRSGIENFDAGRHREACADFSESLKLGPKLGTLLNLALCHEAVGKVATAWREFQHGAAWAAQNNQRDRHDFAMEHLRNLQTRLPRVVLHLPATTTLSSVEVDGEPLPATHWYLPLYLDPGEHAVAVDAPGKKRTTVTFRVTSSPTDQLVKVSALVDDESIESPEAEPSSAPPDRKGPSGRRLAGFATLGVGAAGLAVAATFGILALGKMGSASDRCIGDVCDPEGVQGYRDGQSLARVSILTLPVAVAGLAVGGWLAFGPEPGSSRAARVGVLPRPGGAELAVGATF